MQNRPIQGALPRNHAPARGFFRDVIRQHQLLWMVLPGLIIVFLFNYVPMYGVAISFKSYNAALGIAGSKWVGLKWFQLFFKTPLAWKLIRNTLLLGVYSLVWSFPAPILLALLMDQLTNMRFKKVVQTVSYFPHFISMVVVVGLIKELFAINGLANAMTALFGAQPVSFLTEGQYFRSIFIGSGIWQGIGWGTIIYLAALSNVDPQLYEAADIDGASRWHKVRYITWPCIVPTTTIMLIFAISGILGADSQKVLLMYNPSVYNVADIIGTYVYREGIENGRFEYTSAIGLMNSVVSCALIVLANAISRMVGENSLW